MENHELMFSKLHDTVSHAINGKPLCQDSSKYGVEKEVAGALWWGRAF